MNKFVLFTDSCCDLPRDVRQKYGIEFFRMNIVIDGKEKPADLDFEAYSLEELYSWISSGCKIKTNAVSVEEYINRATPFLKDGYDILYVSCSAALSGSINFFKQLVIPELQEAFPERRIVGIDPFASAMCEGLLVLHLAKAKAAGKDMDELIKLLDEVKFNSNQFATVDTLTYLKNAGRIKGTAAFFGNIIGVKPIFISDRVGNNFVIEKVKGTKNSLQRLAELTVEAYDPSFNEPIIICHADVLDRAEKVKAMIQEKLPDAEIIITWLGPIISITCGVGCVSTFTMGKEVTRFEGDGLKD